VAIFISGTSVNWLLISCFKWLLMFIGRLGYFERKHKFYDHKQLLSEITGHYSQQVEYCSCV